MYLSLRIKNYFPTLFVAYALAGIFVLLACETRTSVKVAYDAYPVYEGGDLGVRFNGDSIAIKAWAPFAEKLRLRVYDRDMHSDPVDEMQMQSQAQGTWSLVLPESVYGMYYTMQALQDGEWGAEVPGPEARVVGTNGLRGQLINPQNENPEGWEMDRSPDFLDASEALIYELHIRDFSIHPAQSFEHKGKYLAFTERGLRNADGLSIGIDHLVEMGITHLHILPAFDFLSIDESRPEDAQFNWGYDPQNYNVPEGSYSTDPSAGGVRIIEFKTMVKALHDAGIRVVMDVVYNHTGKVTGLSFDALAPGYFYRQWEDGSYSNASGCGNEVASDRPMVRNFMIESLKYWVEEYHIDGFRFDLMAIHDRTTMNAISDELHAFKPGILLYGEGWTADDSPLPESERSLKKYTYKLPGIAAFSDDMRDGIKGHWSDHGSKGFVSGNSSLRESVKFGIVGAIQHPDIDYSLVNNSDAPWALDPVQCIGYVSCHDNHTLFEKLSLANPNASREDIVKMDILSNAIVFTSQSIPFMQAGAEFLRSKGGVENSYNAPDSVNQIDWDKKSLNEDVVEAYKSLIAMRKAHPGFRMGSAELVASKLRFLESPESLIAFHIDTPDTDPWEEIVVVYNGSATSQAFELPEGSWDTAWMGLAPVEKVVKSSGQIEVPAISMMVFKRNR